MPNSSAVKRIEQGAFRWAKENTAKNHDQRKRFAREMRLAFLELPSDLRNSIDMALHTAELRGEDSA